MNFSANAIFKSVFAFLVAFAGALGAAVSAKQGNLSQVDVGAWVLALGSGLTAAGALLHTPDKAATGPDKAINTVQDVVAATSQAQDQLTKQAVDAINAVLSAVGKVVPMPTVAIPPTLPSPAPLQGISPKQPLAARLGELFSIAPATNYPPTLGPLASKVVAQSKAAKS